MAACGAACGNRGFRDRLRSARGAVKLSIGATLASHWLMPRLGPFLRAHDQISI